MRAPATGIVSRLDVRPGERFAFSRTFDLDGVAIRLRFRWLPRLSKWLVQVRDVDDVAVALPQIVQAGGFVRFDRRLATMPGGDLQWIGADEYGRADLGETVRLHYTALAAGADPLDETRALMTGIVRDLFAE